ncbi:MAG: hypothetical protein QXX56_01360 [Candidatus Bathyarchaeia archaeon]
MSLNEFLNRIREDLLKRDEMRQEIQILARKTTRLAKQAIFLIHKDTIEEAESLLREASMNISRLLEFSRLHPEVCTGLIETPLQEYAEAKLLFDLVKNKTLINPEATGVPGEFYVLGLSDVIGELRRRALDLIRKNRVRDAEECLNLMENIYSGLIGCDDLQALIPGLRRKCDIARRIIEVTRGDVTIEIRRETLNNSIRELQRALGSIASHVRDE